MKLLKSHALGNDYLVLASEGVSPTPKQVRLLCHRHRGVGSDGLLVPVPSRVADYGLRIYNPDGSEAEKSGNGMRIFARYLVDHAGAPAAFTVETPGGVVSCRVLPDTVEADMGRATFVPAEIPALFDAPEAVDQDLEAGGETFTATCVGIGNPHCVIFRDEPFLDALRWRRWGPLLEAHPAFPNRTNVQFAKLRSPQRIEVRIWERGAGETSASGSSACAVAAAAVRTGRCTPGDITVQAPGGVLNVTVRPDWSITLRGPVEEIGFFHPTPEWLARADLADE